MVSREKTQELGVELLDLERIIEEKDSKLLRSLPKFIINKIKHIVHLDEMNELIFKYRNFYGIEFAKAVLNEFNITVEIIGEKNIPLDGRNIFASNHPLGGVDGVVLLTILDFKNLASKIIVNDLFQYIKNLRPTVVKVNVLGTNYKDYIKALDNEYASDIQIITFPSGEVSRKRKGIITEGIWQKSFIKKAIQHERDIVPIYVDGKNSRFFYNLSNIRKFLGIKTNIELIYLPDEMFKQKNKTIKVYFGKPISYKTLDESLSYMEYAQKIKKYAYNLPFKKNDFNI